MENRVAFRGLAAATGLLATVAFANVAKADPDPFGLLDTLAANGSIPSGGSSFSMLNEMDFTTITAGADALSAEGNFGVGVAFHDPAHVTFYFVNDVTGSGVYGSVSEVYIDDDGLNSYGHDVALGPPPVGTQESDYISAITAGPLGVGVTYAADTSGTGGTSPGDLPNGGSVGFEVSSVGDPSNELFLSADSSGNPSLGLDGSGEYLAATYSLKSGVGFLEVLHAIDDGTIRFGLHVRSIGSGTSASYVSNNPPGEFEVPEPGSLLLLGAGLVGVARIRRRRLGRKA